jgi:hypothetical protein
MRVSMVCSMIVAGLAGASVPMALTLLGQDPAGASSIILTTVTDVVGFLTFLGFATLALGILWPLVWPIRLPKASGGGFGTAAETGAVTYSVTHPG